jgi:hypothetical protein
VLLHQITMFVQTTTSNTTNDNDPEYSLWGARFNTKRSKDTWTFGYK